MSTKAVSAKPKKKVKRNINTGVVHVYSSFNNTIVTISDSLGNTIAWATSGGSGFRGSRKSTPYAAQMAARKAAQNAKECGLKSVDVIVKGPGPGRESAVRAISDFFKVSTIEDRTPIPHNGCKQTKERRV